MTRRLSDEDKLRIRALMRLDPTPHGGYWLWPTNESLALERELTGAADAARLRIEKLKQAKEQA